MKVTALVKYDLYPYYLVFGGELLKSMDVKTEVGTFNKDSILRIRPFHELGAEKLIHKTLKDEYDRLSSQLEVDLLKKYGIKFINKKIV